MRVPRYIEPAFSAIFLTSVAVHLTASRRANSEERAKLTAQTTILGDLIARVRQGERIPEAEYARLLALASYGQSDSHAQAVRPASDETPEHGTKTSWKDVLLGRKPSPQSNEELEEQARLEWEEALRPTHEPQSNTQPSSEPSLTASPSPFPPPTLNVPIAESHKPILTSRYL